MLRRNSCTACAPRNPTRGRPAVPQPTMLADTTAHNLHAHAPMIRCVDKPSCVGNKTREACQVQTCCCHSWFSSSACRPDTMKQETSLLADSTPARRLNTPKSYVYTCNHDLKPHDPECNPLYPRCVIGKGKFGACKVTTAGNTQLDCCTTLRSIANKTP